jgi:energy-converting hydrogenase Eha subunit A
VLTIPFSTVDIFVATRAHNWLLLALAALVSLTWLVVVLCGLWLSDKRRFGLLLLCFIILSGLPVVLMNHLSEQWAYTGVPFVSATIAIGVSEIARRLQGRTILKTAFSIGVIGILALHTASLREKMFLLLKGNDDAVKLRATIADYLDRVPPGGQVWLLNLPSNRPNYGHYLIPPAHLVCESCLAEATKDKHRPDVHYRGVDCSWETVPNPPTNTLMLVIGVDKTTISPQSPIQ